jgi:hypothetical protein
MLIDCPYCQARVAAIELEHHEWYVSGESQGPLRNVLVKCPVCEMSLLGRQELYQTGANEQEWSNLTRLWPDGEDYIHGAIPHDVKMSLHEATLCFRAKAYSACAVMCGKAIEAMSIAHTSERTLHKGLTEMRDSGLIDSRLFDWGDSLRQERNIGAHATGTYISLDDARDVLDFAIAICEYVYVLADRYERYKKRKALIQKGS